jgi:orotate phosphoribosyltransferase
LIYDEAAQSTLEVGVGIDEAAVRELLRSVGAWQNGHFLLSSGLHSDQYIQCQKILQYPRHGLVLAEALVEQVLSAGLRPGAVVGPALGAVHWELLAAQALDGMLASEPVRGIFAERQEGTDEFAIRRGIELGVGEKVLVVEDVTTTGGSAKKVVDLVRELGAEPVAVGAVVDRSGGAAAFDVPFFSLVKLTLSTYEPEACPMCKEGLPLVKPGSSKKAVAY